MGRNIEQNVAGVRLMACQMDEIVVTLSLSKSIAMYSERVGLFSLITNKIHQHKESLTRFVRDTIRGIYFMPPDHGAAVIAEVLNTPELYHSWRQEIDRIRTRIRDCRLGLALALESSADSQSFDYLRQQQGMFSCFPLSPDQLSLLEQEFAIYLLPSGRINFAAMTNNDIEPVARALSSIL